MQNDTVPGPGEEPVLELTGITKSYGRGGRRVEAVQGVDLTVRRGEVVALLGHNGAGKSVTLDIAMGLQSPDSGTVRVCGEDPATAVRHGRIGAMLQFGAMLDDLSVAETVRSVGSLHGIGAAGCAEVLERVGLAPLARRRVGKCSGGERQRLRFALALLPDPDLMVLDEPTAGMDVTARQEFWHAVRDEARAGRTIVFATHYLAEAEEYAPRTVLMAGGRVIADDTTAAVRAQVPGRVLRCDVPDAERVLHGLRGDATVSLATAVTPTRVEMRTTDSDRLAVRALSDWGGRNLEVVPLGLDEAFAELTRAAQD
ncbi:ABC transporter ATP-binding protein [Kytococcus sp. Marseille-QA3725]